MVDLADMLNECIEDTLAGQGAYRGKGVVLTTFPAYASREALRLLEEGPTAGTYRVTTPETYEDVVAAAGAAGPAPASFVDYLLEFIEEAS